MACAEAAGREAVREVYEYHSAGRVRPCVAGAAAACLPERLGAAQVSHV